MITASKLAIAIAVAGPLAAATVGESFATPVPSSAVAVKAAAPAAATDVQYRTYFDYGPSGFPAVPPVSLADRPSPPKAPHRVREGRWWFLVSHGLATQQLRQLGDAGGHAPSLVAVS
jgi:hypothetical protein